MKMRQRWKYFGGLLAAIMLIAGCEGNPVAPSGDSDSDDDTTTTLTNTVTVVVQHNHPEATPGDPQQPNRAPVVVQPLAQTSVATQAVSLPIFASDPDGDDLLYSAGGLPRGLSIDPIAGVITGTISSSSPGDSPFSSFVSASDGARSDTKHFTWTVTAPVSGP